MDFQQECDQMTFSLFQILRKDEVCVYLYKATPGRWDAQLSSIGLETAVDE